MSDVEEECRWRNVEGFILWGLQTRGCTIHTVAYAYRIGLQT